MKITIHIDDEFAAGVDPDGLEQAIETTTKQRPEIFATQPAVNLIITDSQTVAQLNREYRGVDGPTDVLSFENLPDPDFPMVDPTAAQQLGDIVIAYPIAQRQADAQGHPVRDEVTLLAVHGMLHLLGFEHDTPTRKAEMWAVQRQVMAVLGLAHVQPTET